MADWRDVMNARTEADAALTDNDSYGAAIEDGRTPDAALAVTLATRAVCKELRALATLLDYAIGGAR